MQYKANCANPNCDFGFAAPSEGQARDKLNDHLSDSGHVGRLTGVYDSPRNGGWWTENGWIDDDLSKSQKMDIRNTMSAMSQMQQSPRETDSEFYSRKYSMYEGVKEILLNVD